MDKKIPILFLSPQPLQHLLELAASIPLIQPLHYDMAVGEIDSILERIKIRKANLFVIDTYFGPTDMQLFGEFAGMEEKGIDAMRLRVAKEKDLPDSIKLLRTLKVLRPDAKILLVLHKTAGPHLSELLHDLGATVLIVNSESTKAITAGLTELVASGTSLGKDIAKGAKRFGGAARDFIKRVDGVVNEGAAKAAATAVGK